MMAGRPGSVVTTPIETPSPITETKLLNPPPGEIPSAPINQPPSAAPSPVWTTR